MYLDYEAEGLLVACDPAQKVLGSLTFEVVCGGLGVQAKELGSLAGSGGGPALIEALCKHATEIGAQFLVIVPLDRSAAQFWARAGLTSQRLLGWNAGGPHNGIESSIGLGELAGLQFMVGWNNGSL